MKSKQVTFKAEPTKYLPEAIFRPNTPIWPFDMNFIFLNGGGGDYITWMRAIQWLAECATWIKGTLIHPTYMDELASYFLKDYPEWKHTDYKAIQEIPSTDQTPFRGPVVLQNESLNATGAHLFTCGWVYFTNKERAPEGCDRKGRPWHSYPHLYPDYLDSIEVPKETPRPGTYAVITTGITTPSRTIKPEYFNYIIEYVHSLGLQPVFLGKSLVTTGNQSNIHTQFNGEIKYGLGVNLIDKTTMSQAAAIMSKAAVVIGHDNGLLHLAGCTDVPIVFGYNLASPQHRRPIRPIDKIYDVYLDKSELACGFCQSNGNFLIGFNFRHCMYNDLRCMDMLFEDRGRRWKAKIDLALKEGAASPAQ
jgi:hypothetical protein